MPGFCLIPQAVQKFKIGLKDGTINPAKLADMSSEERNKFFEQFVGKPNAKDVNALFESKLLLKNQQQGMISWASKVAGLKEDVRRDLIAKIGRMDRILDPEDKQAFLKDLASTKLGVNVTQDEAKTIADLSKKVETTRSAMESGGNRLDFGHAKVELANYVNSLKIKADKLRLADFKESPVGASGKVLSRVAGNAKAINASMDNSAIFRQGWKTLWTNPMIWQRNARQSFVNLVKQFSGKEVMDEVHADIVSRPNYDKMVKAKLAVGNLEEAFPTTAPEKVPFLGRVYKASEAAYTAFVQKTRADVFDKYIQIAEKSGINTNDPKELQAIGKLVNSLTGRGSLGRLEPVGNTINNVFFSPRFLKSNIDMLTLHAGDKMTPFARKQAAYNLLKVVTGTAAVITVANAVKPGSVELDPRSSDFGKIKIGHTRFDVTGGIGSIMTLASRLATTSSKSTTTGQVTHLNSGKYGAQTSMDVVNNFFENKLSPVAGVIRDILKGKDTQGNKVTASNEIKGLFTPIGVQNYQQIKNDPKSANVLATMIADGLGISANTYGATKTGNGQSTWQQSSSKEIQQFKQSVGMDRFKQAASKYDIQLNNWMDSIKTNKDYLNLSTDQQKEVVTKEKAKIQSDIFKENGFKYKRANPSIQYKQFLK